ncbi:putative RNA-binding protein [Aphis craccivora]|uniref:Putative RNA-binding protein n=1 Tax=Aphis craccivora TaxID=307492 RepID=A0A6G0Z9C7_APHCR|nr:putative RNA-binding protein [Aphis craccivora]
MNVKGDDPESTHRRNLPAFQGIGSVIKTKEKVVKGVVKTQEAEAKRQNALEEKWKTLQNQKFAIANALKGESLNKKIKFDDDGDQQKNDLQLSKQKISLFDDDDASDHENQGELVPDFKLKLRFEGEKGKKLFHMQTAKATGDDRFVMDKRFFEEQETTEKLSDDEIEKQMNILEDVIGRSITKPNKAKGDEIFNMVRYDPTQEEHKKYVKDKPELPKQKRPKKQKVEQNKVVAEAVVDTDKYYKVGDKLKDVFNSENQFSFTSLFQTSDKIDDVDKNEYQSEKITKPQKKFGRNPFIDDSSDSENEENDLEDKKENFDTEAHEVPSGKFLGSRGVWREVFFFKVDDSRFKDAEEFYDPQFNKTHYTGSQDPRFIKKRDLLRDFLKNKDKRHKRDVSKKMFSRKLGGTHNDYKKDKSHKNKPTIKTKKNKEGKKLKSSKTS